MTGPLLTDVALVRSLTEPAEWFGWRSWALELADHVETLAATVTPLVERYGAHWARDEHYYAVAKLLGIEPVAEDA